MMTVITSQEELERFLLTLLSGQMIRVVFSTNASPRIARQVAELVVAGVLIAQPLVTAELFAVARKGIWENVSRTVVFWLGECFEEGKRASLVVASAIWDGVSTIGVVEKS